MKTFKITWRGQRYALEAFSDALADHIDMAPDAISLLKDDTNAEDAQSDWSLEANFNELPDLVSTNIFAHDIAGLEPGILEEVPDIDWVAHALEGLGVVRIGRFVLYGIHDADKLPDDSDLIPIRIDANQAFGTGHHPTTAGCLTLLNRFAGFAPKAILDLGCGSAILSIAAAKLWNQKILASDIDEKSIEVATENVTLNGVAHKVKLLTAAGFDHPKIKSAAPFDFVFANILSGPLCELAPGMSAHVQKNGRVMLAGLLTKQENDVTAAYESAGFRLINRLDQPNWPILLFVKR